MAKATRTNKPLSTLFTDPYLRDRFAAAERDCPPAALAVETDRAPVLAPGVAELVEA